MQAGRHYLPELRGTLSMGEAYRVLFAVLDRHLGAGERQAGWKVGLTAKAMQVQQGVHEPLFGFLLESGHRSSGAALDPAALVSPGFENELCVTIGAPLAGPGVTLADATRAIATVAPAFEIIEKRGAIAGDLPLLVTDNAQQKAFVTGTAVPLASLDLAAVAFDLTVNGTHRERAFGREVLGSPAASVAWLANKLAEFGRALAPGDRIMTGSFTRQYDAAPGDAIEGRFEGIGTVSVVFR